MIKPRPKEKEAYDEYPTHRAKHPPVYRDFDKKARKSAGVKFTPRRGPAKITWPLAPKKALIELTGRHTLARSLVAYVHFFNARLAHWKKRLWNSDAIREMVLDGPWTEEYFRDSAKEYLLYPREGFVAASQKKRISEVFRKLGLE